MQSVNYIHIGILLIYLNEIPIFLKFARAKSLGWNYFFWTKEIEQVENGNQGIGINSDT